jgi:hypothetical protein
MYVFVYIYIYIYTNIYTYMYIYIYIYMFVYITIINKGDFQEAMTETLLAKGKFTAIDTYNRARRLIEKEISFGTTLMRTHVEGTSLYKRICICIHI